MEVELGTTDLTYTTQNFSIIRDEEDCHGKTRNIRYSHRCPASEGMLTARSQRTNDELGRVIATALSVLIEDWLILISS